MAPIPRILFTPGRIFLIIEVRRCVRRGGLKKDEVIEMVLHVYGNPKDPKILALHPMGITGENLYLTVKPYLKGSYCILAPDQGGHGASGPYESLEEETRILKEELLERGFTTIQLLYGASMGVTVGYELLKDPTFQFEKVWFDGGGFTEKAPHFTGAYLTIVRAGLKIYRKCPSLPEKSFEKNYGPKFSKIMLQNVLNMSDDDVIRVFEAFSAREMVRLPRDVQERMHLEWGSEDANYKQSEKALRKYFPCADVIVREGYGHCGFMAFHTGTYVRKMEKFLTG